MKITRATLKSFIKKHQGKLFIRCLSSFDGMVDCVMPIENNGFYPVKPSDLLHSFEHNLGIAGLWLVGCSRDSFDPFNDGNFTGIEIYNCCGHAILAVKDGGQL